MAARKLRALQLEGGQIFHTSEATFDKPRLGDVRIEEGTHRASDGEVMHAQYKHRRTGEVMTVGPANVDFVDLSEHDLHRPRQVAVKVYVFEDRPDKGVHGFYQHRDFQTDDIPRGSVFDKEGFRLGADGKRIQRFADRAAFIPKSEHVIDNPNDAKSRDEALAKAKSSAEKHLKAE